MVLTTAMIASTAIQAAAQAGTSIFQGRSARKREEEAKKEAERAQKQQVASSIVGGFGLLAKDALVTQKAHDKQMKMVRGFNARISTAAPIAARK